MAIFFALVCDIFTHDPCKPWTVCREVTHLLNVFYLLRGLWQALHFYEDGAEGARGHLLHLDEEALAAAVTVVALLDLPQDGSDDEQCDEAPAIHEISLKLWKREA